MSQPAAPAVTAAPAVPAVPAVPAAPAFSSAPNEEQKATLDSLRDTPIPQPILTTARLIIREYHPQDAQTMSLNASTPAIAKYMTRTFPDPYTVEAGEVWIALNIPSSHPSKFAICEVSSPETVIGSIGLKLGADESAHTAEVGFWVGESYWGKGYITEAMIAFTKWAFESYEGKDGQRLQRLYSVVWSGNRASIRCFEKCGYALEGIMRSHVEKNGEVMDVHMFGLLKADWEARE